MEFVQAVVDFNRAVLGIEQRPAASLCGAEFDLSVKCLTEEIQEFVESEANDDYVGQIDAIVDLMYFSIGVLYKLGLTPEQIHKCCMAVHTANITKKRGVNAKRDTGAADAIKPADWVAPEAMIAKIVLG